MWCPSPHWGGVFWGFRWGVQIMGYTVIGKHPGDGTPGHEFGEYDSLREALKIAGWHYDCDAVVIDTETRERIQATDPGYDEPA